MMFDSIIDTKKTMLSLRDFLRESDTQYDPEVFSIISTLDEILDIAETAIHKKDVLNSTEITEIGEHALLLIDNLIFKIGTQQTDVVQTLKKVTLSIAQWVITQNGTLNNIQGIVDALAMLANTIKDNTLLSKLSDFMTQLTHSCSDEIRNDLDNANPSRPWRVLNLNRGIVATRSHDLKIMNAVFPELINAIPMDAPDFFKEGMSEMIRLNYPEEVTTLMQYYHDRSKLPAVH